VAIAAAFRAAKWLPRPAPPLSVRYAEVVESTPGQLSGNCVATNIFSTGWPGQIRITEPFRDLMERQIIIHFADGVAEAIHRGERRKRAALISDCGRICAGNGMV